jgi:membrane-associated phospholipid phosphatase
MVSGSISERPAQKLQLGSAFKNFGLMVLLLARLLVAGYGILLLWRYYPGPSPIGIAFFLGLMIVLFLALPMAPSDSISTLRRCSWWFAYAAGFVAFAILRSFADDGQTVYYHYPVRFGDGLFGTPAPVYLQHVLPDPSRHDPFTLLMVATYISYFVVPTAIALYLARRRPERFPRYVIAVSIMFMVGLIAYRLFPTAPPWMASRDGYIPSIYRVTSLIFHPDTYSQGINLVGSNDVGAMPSIHVAETWLAIFAIRFRGRLARILGVTYGCMMMFAVVYLGEHWMIDVIAGFSLSCAIWYGTRTLASVKWPAIRRVFVRDTMAQQV